MHSGLNTVSGVSYENNNTVALAVNMVQSNLMEFGVLEKNSEWYWKER